MKQKTRVHASTRVSVSSLSMLSSVGILPGERGSSAKKNAWENFSTADLSNPDRTGQEIMVDSAQKSAFDLLKLLGLIVPQLMALIFVSVLLITESVDVMRHSVDLKQHVQWMEPIRLVITQLQREREMTCVLISTFR